MSESITEHARIEFDSNLIPRKLDGERLNVGIVSLVVSTLHRTAAQIGNQLGLGELKFITSLGGGAAMKLDITDTNPVFTLLNAVTNWAEADGKTTQATQLLEYPLLPNVPEIRSLLESTQRIRSCSFQRLNSGNWEHTTFDENLPILTIEAVAMLLLQMNVLCREQKYPRGRLRIRWEQGTLWFWVTQGEKLMIVLTDASITPEEDDLVVRCGEAFQLL